MTSSWADRRPVATRVSAAEAVFTDLRQAIESGDLPVGERLPSEAALGERYAVSRSVVREALRSCTALGLTETRTGRGTFVVSSTASHDLKVGEYTARELMEARPHIEIPAAGWAAERRSTEDLRQLTELTQAMAAESNQTDWVALDGQFHLAVTRASGNRVFQNALVNIRNSLTAQSATLNLATGRMRRSNEEHERIVEAISSGDRQAAERAMADHLDAVQVAVRSLTH
ncbi:putative GntR family transcriptional regulator [Gordonia polyisoprenivorans NBRC 16320 = JCM 10675]|uniref:FadR family transcriptional regulator n=1 Tax=Gordonia polyisoprenivorans TaxID=84595 RepID=A0A846WK03_9ACTN|nr:FadR/GntR family transcriptional regulator [Gordonia polyisoprenivorans]NKY02012.1 FadR family transcriptional regulator [Gordonia polyisoprenivorans]GAB23778.1 putative GntR family transcriptional regulator [Gordonia polyisoprenivorans NBRC 16320 = JCM 10675]